MIVVNVTSNNVTVDNFESVITLRVATALETSTSHHMGIDTNIGFYSLSDRLGLLSSFGMHISLAWSTLGMDVVRSCVMQSHNSV